MLSLSASNVIVSICGLIDSKGQSSVLSFAVGATLHILKKKRMTRPMDFGCLGFRFTKVFIEFFKVIFAYKVHRVSFYIVAWVNFPAFYIKIFLYDTIIVLDWFTFNISRNWAKQASQTNQPIITIIIIIDFYIKSR